MKKIGALILVILALFVGLVPRMAVPEDCALCTAESTHCPVLVNLSTGEIGNLMVYNLHNASPSRLAPTEEQQTGTFSFLSCAGLIGYRDMACELVSIDIPEDADSPNRWMFCTNCWELVKRYPEERFLIADLYDPESPVLLPIVSGASYQMRCYTIVAEYNEERARHTVTVYGELDVA